MDPKAPTPALDPQTPEAEAPEVPEQAPTDRASEPDPEAAPSDEEPAESKEPKPKEELAAAGAHKRQGGYQRRIERLERQNQQLLDQLQRGGATPVTPKEKTAEEKAAEQFERLVDQRLQQRDAAQRQQMQVAEFQKRAHEARTAHPDWDDAISGLDIPTNSPLGHALLTSESGPEIMYQLAANPAELARISALPPFDAAREIGRLEAKAASGAAPHNPNPAKRPPAPPLNVGGTAAKPTQSIETLPIAEFKKARRAGRG